MNLSVLSFKNATVKLWRSMTLGFFIFTVAFVVVLSGTFITSATRKVEKVIFNGFTGHIQLRSKQSRENDMVSQYNQGWDALRPIEQNTKRTVDAILQSNFAQIKPTALVRRSANLVAGGEKKETMLIGLDPGMDTYQEAFLLSEGRYLSRDGSNEILLTREQADLYGVQLGDFIRVTTKNRYGLQSEMDLEIVGVGDFVMLSLFSYNANYTSRDVVQRLAGYKENEVTDILLFLNGSQNTDPLISSLTQALGRKGIEYAVTSKEKLTSKDLRVTEISFDDLDSEEVGIKISTWDEMGETFTGVTEAMLVVINLLVLFLMVIIGILIFNLVYVTGIERYREIGTLRAIGFSQPQVMRIFIGEILSVSLLATILGACTSFGLILLINGQDVNATIPFLNYIMGKTLQLEPDFSHTFINLLVITGFTFLSSFFPAYRACSVDPAQTMRTV